MRLLIVDDEPLAIEWICGIVDWKVLGITEVTAAESVGKAEKILLENKVDIVLLDIEMPQENGFILLEWMKEKSIKAECIFLTGHNEFSYAQRAIKYGCLSYLLKPVEESELVSTVAEAICHIKEKEEIRQDFIYSNYWKNSKESFDEKFYEDIILHRISEKQIVDRAKQISVDVRKMRYQIVMLDFRFLNVEFNEWGQDMRDFVVRNILNETIACNGEESVILPLSEEEWAVILIGEQIRDKESLHNRVGKFIDVFANHLKSIVTVYLSVECNIYNLAENYEILQSYMNDNVAYFGRGLYQEEMPLWRTNFCSETKFEEWQVHLKNGKTKFVNSEICEFLDAQVKQKKISRKFLERFYRRFLVMILNISYGNKQNISRFIDSALTQDAILKANRSVEDVKQIINLLLQEVFEEKLSTEKNYDCLANKVSDYIKENIGGDLNCDAISSYFGFNADYLSRIMKQEIGKTLGELYTEIRMNYAKKLLETTNLSITEIVIRSGYHSIPHFSKMFRMLHGISPSTYRKSILYKNEN